MGTGRPPKYDDVNILSNKIDEYFNYCDEETHRWTDKKGNEHIEYKPYTVSGLCLYLDITRETLCQYENKEIFSDTIKRAKNRIENWIEEHSISGELNPVVSIFNLKNNFGWKDKQEIESNNTNTNKTTMDLSKFTVDQLKEMIKE